MKEIRFRSWNGKEMAYYPYIYFGDMHISFCEEVYRYIDDMPGEAIPIMQFTGLQDRKGEEIYEGDILKVLKLDHSYQYAEEGKIGYVEWDNRYTGYLLWFPGLEDGEYLGNLAGAFRNPMVEVIGNIYENPDLIEKV